MFFSFATLVPGRLPGEVVMLRRTTRFLAARLFRHCLIGVVLGGAVFAFSVPPSMGQDATAARQTVRKVIQQGEPGKFDFYLLALSWSPSFARRRANATPAGVTRNAANGLMPLWCMGCGRSMSVVSHRTARYRRRGFRAPSSTRCST
jgi:hypothetical protein